jgi:hypothetical protein
VQGNQRLIKAGDARIEVRFAGRGPCTIARCPSKVAGSRGGHVPFSPFFVRHLASRLSARERKRHGSLDAINPDAAQDRETTDTMSRTRTVNGIPKARCASFL